MSTAWIQFTFPYLYVRYIDEIDVNGTMTDVVDTLIVQFFKFDNLRR